MLVKPRRAKASETAHVQWVSDENCTVTADQNADVHNAYGACRNPQTSIDCGQGVTVTTDVDLDPVDSIVDTAEVGVQTDSVPTRVVWGGGDSQVTIVAARWGAAGFRSRGVRLARQHSLGCGRCCLHLVWWAVSGRSFLLSRGGPKSHSGIVPRSVLCAAGGGAAVWRLAGSRGDQTAGKNGSHGGMRVQHKCACVRPDRGSLTSHQDRTASTMFGPCPPSTVHLQSTLIIL